MSDEGGLPRDVVLPPFDAEKTCDKCGHDEIRTRFETRCSSREPCYPFGYYVGGDHFHRRCCRCGFVWFERPIDTAAVSP